MAQVGRLGEAPASEPLGDAVEGVGAVEHDHVAGHLQRGVPGLDGVLPVQVGFDVAGLGDPAVPTDLVDAEDIAPGRGIREGAVRLGPALAEIESKKSAGVSLEFISLVQLALGGSEPGRIAPQKAHADVRSVHVGGPRVLVAGRQREDSGRVRLAGVHRRGQHGHHRDGAALVPEGQVQRRGDLREKDQRHRGDAFATGEGRELRTGGGERRGQRREQKPKLLVRGDRVPENGPSDDGEGRPSLLIAAGHRREG